MRIYETLEEWIRDENSNQDSVDDQVRTAHWFLRHDITVIKDRDARTNQVRDRLGDRLDYQIRTVLDNLEEIGVLVQFDPPGNGSYIRHHRTGQNFFDPRAREWVPFLEEDLSRFIEDMQTQEVTEAPPVADGGSDNKNDDADVEANDTLRSVAADVLDVDPDGVEDALTSPADMVEQMTRYDMVVKTVKSNEETSRKLDYDEMGWRNSALRWSLSERATRIEMNRSVSA